MALESYKAHFGRNESEAVTNTLAVVLLAYLCVILGISVWSAFRTKTEEDFIAAGRTIGPFVGGAVLAATQISAGTVVGTLGRHYLGGVSWWYIWFGAWAGWLVSAFFVAPKLRRFGALTVPDYIAARFGSETARALAPIQMRWRQQELFCPSKLHRQWGYHFLLICRQRIFGERFSVCQDN